MMDESNDHSMTPMVISTEPKSMIPNQIEVQGGGGGKEEVETTIMINKENDEKGNDSFGDLLTPLIPLNDEQKQHAQQLLLENNREQIIKFITQCNQTEPDRDMTDIGLIGLLEELISKGAKSGSIKEPPLKRIRGENIIDDHAEQQEIKQTPSSSSSSESFDILYDEKSEVLGQGTNGRVIRGQIINRSNGDTKVCAIKFFNNYRSFMNEKRIFSLLSKQPHYDSYIPRFYRSGEIINDKPWPFIAMEYYPMTLQMIIPSLKNNLGRTINILLKIAKSINFLHENNIAHRDLKSGNIVIDADDSIRIIDFGGSSDNNNYAPGTPGYQAPEKMIDERPEDIFSFGMIMLEIILHDISLNDKVKIMKDVGVKIKNGDDPDIVNLAKITDLNYYRYGELMQVCWRKEKDKRPSIRELVDYLFYFKNAPIFSPSSSSSFSSRLYTKDGMVTDFLSWREWRSVDVSNHIDIKVPAFHIKNLWGACLKYVYRLLNFIPQMEYLKKLVEINQSAEVFQYLCNILPIIIQIYDFPDKPSDSCSCIARFSSNADCTDKVKEFGDNIIVLSLVQASATTYLIMGQDSSIIRFDPSDPLDPITQYSFTKYTMSYFMSMLPTANSDEGRNQRETINEMEINIHRLNAETRYLSSMLNKQSNHFKQIINNQTEMINKQSDAINHLLLNQRKLVDDVQQLKSALQNANIINNNNNDNNNNNYNNNNNNNSSSSGSSSSSSSTNNNNRCLL